MNNRSIAGVVIVVAVLVGAGAWLVNAQSINASKKTIQTEYSQVKLPAILSQQSASFSGSRWTYTYNSSVGRTATYTALVTSLKAQGYSTGGQTGEFIFTSGSSKPLSLSVTLSPADQSSLNNVQIEAEESPK